MTALERLLERSEFLNNHRKDPDTGGYDYPFTTAQLLKYAETKDEMIRIMAEALENSECECDGDGACERCHALIKVNALAEDILK